MENAQGSWGDFFEFEIVTRSGVEKVIIDWDQREQAEAITRWGIFKDRKDRKLARAGKEDGQVFLHKILVDIPKGSRLEWKNGNSLDLRRKNLQLIDKNGAVTELEPKKVTEPEYMNHTTREVMKEAQEETAATAERHKDPHSTYEALTSAAAEGIPAAVESMDRLEPKKTSDVPGVYFHKNSQRWHASAFWGGKRYSLGYFAFQEDAELEIKIFRSAGPDSPALKRNQNKKRKGDK